MVFRSRRLEALLGGTFESVTYSDVVSLIGNENAGESDDIDYKIKYEMDADGRAELAKDIAAFANAIGGLLVIGVADNKTALPVKVLDTTANDQFLRWIRETAAAKIMPLPTFDLRALQNPTADSGTGIVLVGIPRSPAAPHAVLSSSRPDLAYPRRHGTTTTWLSEPAVATAYRARFSEAGTRDERVNDVEREILETFLVDKQYDPLVTVTLVPTVPGDFSVDRESYDKFRRDVANGIPLLGITQQRLIASGVGADRLQVDDGLVPSKVRVELHSDGSGAWAASPWWDSTSGDQDVAVVHADNLVLQILNGLRILSRHASERAGLAGTALVRVGLWASLFEHHQLHFHRNPMMGDPAPTREYVQIGRFSSDPNRIKPFSHRRLECVTNDSVCVIGSAAEGGSGLAASTALAVRTVFQAFGMVEAPQLNADGQVRRSGWHRQHHEWLDRWAEETDVAVEGELPG